MSKIEDKDGDVLEVEKDGSINVNVNRVNDPDMQVWMDRFKDLANLLLCIAVGIFCCLFLLIMIFFTLRDL